MKTVIAKIFLVLGILLGLSAIACAQDNPDEVKIYTVDKKYAAIQFEVAVDINEKKATREKEAKPFPVVTKKDIKKNAIRSKDAERKTFKAVPMRETPIYKQK